MSGVFCGVPQCSSEEVNVTRLRFLTVISYLVTQRNNNVSKVSYIAFLLDLLFEHENGSDIYLWSIGISLNDIEFRPEHSKL
jgi:hypothetical protein